MAENDGFAQASELAVQEAARIKEEQARAAETPEAKATKEAAELEAKNKEKEAAAETPEAKAARELKEKQPQETPEEKSAREAKELEEAEKGKKKEDAPDPVSELLKDTKFKTKEDLLAHLNKEEKKIESPEEIKRKEEIYRANLNQFAVSEGILSNEDIVKLEVLKQKADKDLVFEKFVAEIKDEITEDVKKENPDATKEEIDAKIKEAFEDEYPVESKNEKTKTRAENKIAKEAKELRGPLESSFTSAKKKYDDEVSIRNAYPEYHKSIETVTTELIPKSYSFFKDKDGDKEIEIPVKISDEDRKEILSDLQKRTETAENFLLYKEGKIEEVKKIAQQTLEFLLWTKYHEQGKKEIAKKYESRGLGKGSTTGAESSFAQNQGEEKEASKESAESKEKQIIESTRQKP